MTEGRLAGRTAIITGASRGIGRAIAERYAGEGADLFLAATGLDQLQATAAGAREAGARVELFACDVAERGQVEAMFEAALGIYPGLDVVVNNAGIYKSARFVDYSPDDFDRVMRVNAYGVFHVMQLALRHFHRIGGGKIVNVASTAGKWESANQAAYNASKHAVIGLTRCAALENASLGININAICPGLVDTDMFGEFEVHAAAQGVDFETFKAQVLERVPIGRLLDPMEIAHLAVYLASAEADGMTGQTITISGGMRMG